MKAQGLRPQQLALHSQANANRRFRYLSHAVEDNRSKTAAQHAAFALIQRGAHPIVDRIRRAWRSPLALWQAGQSRVAPDGRAPYPERRW